MRYLTRLGQVQVVNRTQDFIRWLGNDVLRSVSFMLLLVRRVGFARVRKNSSQ